MATRDHASDAAPAHPDVLTDVQELAQDNRCVLKLKQYLTGSRTRNEIDMSSDIMPALRALRGAVVMRFQHTAKTEYVWPAEDHDAVSSCFHDTGEEFMSDVPISRLELEDWRDTPKPSEFLPAENVDHVRPDRALGGAK